MRRPEIAAPVVVVIQVPPRPWRDRRPAASAPNEAGLDEPVNHPAAPLMPMPVTTRSRRPQQLGGVRLDRGVELRLRVLNLRELRAQIDRRPQ
jgi:hypothetical protein